MSKDYKLKAYQDTYYFYFNHKFMNEVKSDVYISSIPKGYLSVRGYSFESLWNFLTKTKYYFTVDAFVRRSLFRKKRVIEFYDHTYFPTILKENPKKLHGCNKLTSWKMVRYTDEVELKVYNSSRLDITSISKYIQERVNTDDVLED